MYTGVFDTAMSLQGSAVTYRRPLNFSQLLPTQGVGRKPVPTLDAMPLIKIFTRQPESVPSASELLPRLLEIWNVPARVIKVLVIRADDWSDATGEAVYADVRAKATPERTPEAVQAAVKAMASLFESYGLVANVRVELYDPALQHTYHSRGKDNRCARTVSSRGVRGTSRGTALQPALWSVSPRWHYTVLQAIRRRLVCTLQCDTWIRSAVDLLTGLAISLATRAVIENHALTLFAAARHDASPLLLHGS